MNKLFIDTNVFYEKGFNFDLNNDLISLLVKNVKENIYEFNNLSIIDSEIRSHLISRGDEEFNKFKNQKWLKEYVSDDIIKRNCYKDLFDYEKFLKEINAISCNVSKIDPEQIFQKYFNFEFPFEKNSEKRKEFPDAFISFYINNLPLSDDELIYFVTSDNGLKKSINRKNVKIYKNLGLFLSDFNDILPYEYKQIRKSIDKTILAISDNIFKRANLLYYDLEDETIDLRNIKIGKISDIQIIDNKEDSFVINCICDFLILEGDFSCFDYNNSYMPRECDYYVTTEYINLSKILIPEYEFSLKMIKTNGKYEIIYNDKYDILINYDLMTNFREYQEGSWDQDGGPWR